MTEEEYENARENRSRKRAIGDFLDDLNRKPSNVVGYGYHKDYLVGLLNEKLGDEIMELDLAFEKL